MRAGDWRRTSWVTVQFVPEFAEAEVWGAESSAQEGEAFVIMDLPSSGGFGRMGVLGFGWNMLAFCGVQIEASVRASLETHKESPSSRPAFRRRERKQSSPGGCRRSQIVVNPHRWLPQDRWRGTVGLKGRLVAPSCAGDPLVPKDKRYVITVPVLESMRCVAQGCPATPCTRPSFNMMSV